MRYNIDGSKSVCAEILGYFTIYRISLALSRLNEFLGIKRIRKEKIQSYKKIFFFSDSAQNHFRVFLISPKERDR